MIPVYNKDLDDLGLSKYYELDLDEKMMREDLRQMNIMRIHEHETLIEKQIKEAKLNQKNEKWTKRLLHKHNIFLD